MCDSARLQHIPCFRIAIAAELQKYADKLIPICIITCVLFLLWYFPTKMKYRVPCITISIPDNIKYKIGLFWDWNFLQLAFSDMCTVNIDEILCPKLSEKLEGQNYSCSRQRNSMRAYGCRPVTTQAEERQDRNDGQSQDDQKGVNTNTIALTTPHFLYFLVEKRQEIQRVLSSRAVSLVDVPCLSNRGGPNNKQRSQFWSDKNIMTTEEN